MLTPPIYSEILHRSIPNATLIKIPAAGHYVLNEQPDAFQNHIQEFLERLDNQYL